MFGQTFYHKTIRKYVAYFGTLFNDIYITRDTSSGNSYSTLKVPITYGPKQKTLARVNADPNLNMPASIVLPRLSFELRSIAYSPTRKLNTASKGYVKKDPLEPNKNSYVYNPVPYDFTFSLYVMVKNAEDGTRILEQILPFFTPEWTATLNLIPSLGVKLDIPVVIQNVTSSDTYEGNFEQNRIITWQLDFSMYGYLFGPVKKANVITLANTNFFSSLPDTSPTVIERVTITPGLTAEGVGTTDPDLTIDRNMINEDDDWEYIIQKETYE